jgi:FlaA1/EpsC-like NDP-sugar epimerase
VLGQGGEVFMLDMGEPMKIVDLARDLIELSGLEVGRDIDIAYTGIRPGEKLYEELFIPGEIYQRTEHQKIFVIGNANGLVPDRINQAVGSLESAARNDDVEAVLEILADLLPRYQLWATPETDRATSEAAVASPLESAV